MPMQFITSLHISYTSTCSRTVALQKHEHSNETNEPVIK